MTRWLTHCVLLQTETKDQHRRIAVQEGELQLQPQLRSCDGLFQVFLSTKVLGIVTSNLTLTAKSKELEREVDKVHTELGFSFIDISSRYTQEPPRVCIIFAILVWIEKNLERSVPSSSTRLVQKTLQELKAYFFEKDERMRGDVQDQWQQDDGLRKATITTRSGTSESTFNHVFKPKSRSTDQGDNHDLFHPLDSFPTDKSVCQSGSTVRVDTTISNRPSDRRKQKAQSTINRVAPVLVGCKRSLSELKKEFYGQHTRAKRRKRQKHDVVSGKGEKAKIQNAGYLELIRSNAPFFRAMNTGDPDTDLEEKRRLAYCICIKVVDRGGCFLGKDNKPMEAHKAFKRVMTSLKDWRKPADKKTKQAKISQKETLSHPKLNHRGENQLTRYPVIVSPHNQNGKLTGFKLDSHVDKDEPEETEDPVSQHHQNDKLADLKFDFHTQGDVLQDVILDTKEGQKIQQVIPDQLLSDSQMMSMTSSHSSEFLLGSLFDIHDNMSIL